MQITTAQVHKMLEEVADPEIPVLTIADLGIVRDVAVTNGNEVRVVITPTYSGCPAMNTIEKEIKEVLEQTGISVAVETQLSPPWTTDWMSENGKRKLEAYGIAPPQSGTVNKRTLFGAPPEVRCPHCKSENTQMISQFGSTACKALYKCNDCLEPFDYFKCL
ncbi:MAG: phenylacetate-CoA oxygenase subunit PaaJ [Schleiferiaceae bacterium]|nr:phenylacetate-CoA oxygenase subunit PaaJ [Schleiferiaceae bacterium]